MRDEEMNLGWSGWLSIKNIDRVAELLRKLLGGKRFTFVAVNELHGFRPEVYTGQRLGEKGRRNQDSSVAIKVHHYNGHSLMIISDTSGVGSFSTIEEKEVLDPDFKTPYFSFNWNTVTITHRVPAGHKVFWVFAVENDN